MDGLRPMLRRFFRILGLPADQTMPHLRTRLPNATSETLDLVFRELFSDDDSSSAHQAPPEERWSAVRAVLGHLAQQRPLIMWLDDVQWGPDSLGFARWMAEHSQDLPILVLCTAQSEALAEAPNLNTAVQLLLQGQRTSEVPVGPLPEHARTELVSALLGLEGALARQLAARTAGNPLFTVQLVGDWVARGVLVPGKNGFRLRPGESAALPDSLHEVWSARLDRLLAGKAPQVRLALEIAATLGQEVADSEWKSACATASIEIPQDLVHALTEGRLAVPSDEGFAFSHGMLRESLVRQAVDSGRWPQLNQWCAIALIQLGDSIHDVRVGTHLSHAGKYTEAVEHLRVGAMRLLRFGHASEALGCLHLAQDCLSRGGVPTSDSRWGKLWLQLSRTHHALTRDDHANRLARKTLSFARRYHWSKLDGSAFLRLAEIEQSRGNIPSAFRFSEQALSTHGPNNPHPNPLEHGQILITLAHCSILAADMERAKEYLATARPIMEATSNHSGMAKIIRFEGDIARMEMRFERARDLFVQASNMALKAGLRSQSYASLHGVAEMDRLSGNLAEAEEMYLHVQTYQQQMGQTSLMTSLNLGQCAVARKKFSKGREILTEILEVFERTRRPGYSAATHIALLPAVAGLGDWDAFATHLEAFVHLAETSGMTDIDTAINAELAGDLAAEARMKSKALEAWKLSHETWTAMGGQEPAMRVAKKLQDLLQSSP